MQPEFQHLPVGQLIFSSTVHQTERRAHFDKASLKELAESIGAIGIAQPILVRRRGEGESLQFEVVAGERRVLASKMAGLSHVPAMVREISDEQLLELQLVENLQREDVHPMAEAEGYESLRKLGRTTDEIADKVGKSKAYVYARMKLLDLVKECRTAFYAGKLNSSTALYIARVPMGLQLQALKGITEDRWNGPMSAREAQSYLQREFMLRLGDAPFNTKDANLVAGKPACAGCPKRSGNNPDLFGDVSGADVCTDPICYRQKVKAHNNAEVAKAEKAGQKVIRGSQAKKLFKHGSISNGYVDLEDKSYEDSKMRSYAQILGKGYVPTLVEVEDNLIRVAPIADLPKSSSRSAGSSTTDTWRARQAAETKKNLAEREYRGALFHKVREAAAKAKSLSRLNLEGVAEALLNRLSHDELRQYFKVMGWEGKKSKLHGGREFDLPTEISEHSDAELAPELMVGTYGTGKGEGLHAAATFHKIDAKKVRAALATEKKAKAKKPEKSKAPAKKK